jgi:predicted amidohydrolase YtcJ
MAMNEQLYFGGEIYTVDVSNPTIESLAVKNGIIVAVGSQSDCRSALGSTPELVDLKGSVMLPGFIDTHLHPPLMILFEMNTDLSKVTSLEELKSIIANKAQGEAGNDWIMGLQFDEHLLDPPRVPNRHDLDAACCDRPVLIVKRDGHTIIGNTAAIEAAGVSALTSDPEGGKIQREGDGYPSGVFSETAMSILLEEVPFPELETIIEAGISVFDRIGRHGITSVGMILQTDEEGISGTQGVYDIPLLELLLDRIPINLYTLLVAKDVEKIVSLKQSEFHNQETASGRRIGGLKFWADGTLSSCTAYMQHPFSDFPDQKGFLIHSPDEMYSRMAAAHNAGEQIAIHSIGDASTRTCVDLFDRLLKEYPNSAHRHRLEHASQLDAQLIKDIARLNLVVSTQPMFIHSEKKWLAKRLGPERIKWTYAFRSLLDAGVIVAGASDAPIEELNVLQAIGCCVTRDGFEPRQGITVEEAIRLFTINAAYAQFEESVKGSLSTGKRADMVILDKSPISVPPHEIKNIQIKQTICNGIPIYTG